MMGYPSHMSAVEAQIVDIIIEGALSQGLLIRIYDGEEWAMDAPTQDAEAIRREVAATESTHMHFYRPLVDGLHSMEGFVWLIHGNECDVISDCSVGMVEHLLMRADAKAEELSMAGAA